jgi:hypothetical protein
VVVDLEGDGTMELVNGENIFRFNKADKSWGLLRQTDQPRGQVAVADFGTYGASSNDRSTRDGLPELAVVSNGTIRVQTPEGRVILGPTGLPGGGVGGAPTVADFDGDGRPEVGVAGAAAYTVFDPDCSAGADATVCPTGRSDRILWSRPSQDQSSNMTGSSVFDFEGDGRAEVVYADECFSRVYDGRSGQVLFSQYHTSCTWYENPIVADVDGDFRSEIVIPSNTNCGVVCPGIDPIHNGVRCESTADCPGVTVCAKEQPGDATGLCRCSTTADCGASNLACVDPASGASPAGKVCRASFPVGERQTGIVVLADVLDRWVSSRPIWNQHAYSVTNINDDGTVPTIANAKSNWKTPELNNYRMNVQGTVKGETVPDMTSQSHPVQCDNGTAKLQAKVCNRGTAPVAGGVPVTFYRESTMPSNKICTATSTQVLAPGSCEVVSCDWVAAPDSEVDVIIQADDDGSGKGASTECEENNNTATLKGVRCQAIG